MSETKVHVRTLSDSSAAVGWSGPRTVTIDRPEASGGLGIGFNGGELLFLSIGACFTNDLYREAAKTNLTLKSVRVDVEGDWGGDGVRAQNVNFQVRVETNSGQQEILDLVQHTDRVAEIHNSLRMGTNITLAKTEIVPV